MRHPILLATILVLMPACGSGSSSAPAAPAVASSNETIQTSASSHWTGTATGTSIANWAYAQLPNTGVNVPGTQPITSAVSGAVDLTAVQSGSLLTGMISGPSGSSGTFIGSISSAGVVSITIGGSSTCGTTSLSGQATPNGNTYSGSLTGYVCDGLDKFDVTITLTQD